MKKSCLLLALASVAVVGCGDSYDSLTINQLFNEISVKEQEKVAEYVKQKLPAPAVQKLGFLAFECSKQMLQVKSLGTGKPVELPKKCDQTLGEFIKANAK